MARPQTGPELPDLTPIEWQAVQVLARWGRDKRDEVDPGAGQEVDFVLHVKGTIDVAEDREASRVRKPTVEEMLAYVWWALDTSGHAEASAILRERMRQTAADGQLPDVEEGYNAQALMLISALSPTVPAERKGQVRGCISAECTMR